MVLIFYCLKEKYINSCITLLLKREKINLYFNKKTNYKYVQILFLFKKQMYMVLTR